MRIVGVCVLSALLGTSVSGRSAHASTEPTVDIQLFHPTASSTGFLSTESGEVMSHLGMSAGLSVTYARNPLAVRIVQNDGSEKDVGAVIKHRLDCVVLGAIGLFDFAEIGVAMPMVAQGGYDSESFEAAKIAFGTGSVPGFTQGDIRLIPKIRAFSIGGGVFSGALIPTVIIPSAQGAAYAGEAGTVFAPALAFSSRMAFIRFGFDIGYRMRERTEVETLIVDDEAFFKLGAAFDLNLGRGSSPVEIIAEVFGHTPADDPFGLQTRPADRKYQTVRTAIEGDVGLRIHLFENILFTVGGGGGVWPGYGAPSPRLFASLGLTTGTSGRDVDDDTVSDWLDLCKERPEDFDGFEDEDGCPDADNDQDAVLDEDDQCPMVAEDRDGYEDHDGCPEPDNDEDGIADDVDGCPTDAEDKDGFADDDGCPENDNDGDGFVDSIDTCPDDAEDKDGFNDEDGCPEPDNDGDGLDDLGDLCPNKPETYNGFKDDDGCPDARKAKSFVKVTLEKIEIKKRVFFKTGKAVIQRRSFELLDQVASVLLNYTRIKKVRVEGHTDSRGSAQRNMKLSQERAEAVVAYLVDKGIARERLEPVGFGADKPIASNRTKRGRDTNRRVEFVIVEQVSEVIKVVEHPQSTPPDEALSTDDAAGTAPAAAEQTPSEPEDAGRLGTETTKPDEANDGEEPVIEFDF